jgi:hypothetical protein
MCRIQNHVPARKNSEPEVRPGTRLSDPHRPKKSAMWGDMTLLCESRVVGDHMCRRGGLSHNKRRVKASGSDAAEPSCRLQSVRGNLTT